MERIEVYFKSTLRLFLSRINRIIVATKIDVVIKIKPIIVVTSQSSTLSKLSNRYFTTNSEEKNHITERVSHKEISITIFLSI